MKVPQTSARQERRERRIRRREEVAEQHRLEAEARVSAHEERRRKWIEGGRVMEIWCRGWEKPFVLDFSGPAIPCMPEEFIRMASLPVAEVARIVAEAEEKDQEDQRVQKLVTKVLRDLNVDRDGGCRGLYLSVGQVDEN